MIKNNRDLAKEYYTAMSKKNIKKLSNYLHANVTFKSPLVSLEGKEAVIEAVENFMNFFKNLIIEEACGSEDAAMIAYTVDSPMGLIPTAALLKCESDLIISIQLFFDTQPFKKL